MKEILLHIGGGSTVDSRRVISICPYNLLSLKRMAKAAEDQGKLFDVSGKKAKNSFVLLEENVIFLSPVYPDTLRKRFDQIFADVSISSLETEKVK